MSTNIRFTIDEDQLGPVGTLVPGEKSPISLIQGTGKPVDPAVLSRIRSAGIIDGDGKIRGEYLHAAETLARSRSFSRLKFSAGEKLFEFIVYFPTDNSSPVSVIHNNDQLIVQDPAAVDEAFGFIDQNVGHSALASQTFNGQFSPQEALALFALLDLERSALLLDLSRDTVPVNAAFGPEAILDKIMNRKEHFQSLEFVLQSRLILPALPGPGEVGSALTTLIGKGFVVKEKEKFRLGDTLYAIASRLLIIDSFVAVETARLDESGTMSGGSFISLQAGVNDLLYIEGHAEDVIVKFITGFELMDLANKFMSDPALVIGAPVAQKSASSGGGRLCPKCGSPVKEGLRFCSNCGNKIV